MCYSPHIIFVSPPWFSLPWVVFSNPGLPFSGIKVSLWGVNVPSCPVSECVDGSEFLVVPVLISNESWYHVSLGSSGSSCCDWDTSSSSSVLLTVCELLPGFSSRLVAQGTLDYLLCPRLTMATDLYLVGLYLGLLMWWSWVYRYHLLCQTCILLYILYVNVDVLRVVLCVRWDDRDHVMSSHFGVLIVSVPYFVLFLLHLFYYHTTWVSLWVYHVLKEVHTVPGLVLCVCTLSHPVLFNLFYLGWCSNLSVLYLSLMYS